MVCGMGGGEGLEKRKPWKEAKRKNGGGRIEEEKKKRNTVTAESL